MIKQINKITSNNIKKYYKKYNEDIRLFKDKHHFTEFLLTHHWINKFLFPTAKIIEIGAGTGAYSLKLAQEGYCVDAVELVESNVKVFKSKIEPTMNVNIIAGNAINLGNYNSNSFDIVLCLGPLYHLNGKELDSAIKEAIRVCKPNGKIFFSYISNNMIFALRTVKEEKYLLKEKEFNKYFNVLDRNFNFFEPYKFEKLMKNYNIEKNNHVATDGITRLLKNTIDNLTQQEFEVWIQFLIDSSDKFEYLGYSEHNLFICTKL